MSGAQDSGNPFLEFLGKYRNNPVEMVRDVLGAEPDEPQKQVLGWIAGGERRVSVRSGHGVGKALSLDAVVPCPSGERRWGDIEPGDQVFGADGRPTLVRATSEYQGLPMYRVTFDDGSYCDVSSGHLWNVRGRKERRTGDPCWRTLETVELMELGVKRNNGVAFARQWEIPVQGAVEFDAREVDLHPYLVGVWLGDGTKGEPQWTKPCAEVAERVQGLGYELSCQERLARYRVLNSTHLFRDHVFSLGSHERYIPDDYKYNTVDNRLALFEGLCDTDGEVQGSGSIEYSSSSRRLAEDVVWLARSLGCKAWAQKATKRGRYETWLSEYVDCRDSYRVTINAPFNPFTVPHKRNFYKPSEHRYTVRWIDSIEPVGVADCKCIEVAAPDGLYQGPGFTVTHNSTVASWAMLWFLLTRYPVKVVVTAPTSAQLYDALFAELKYWVKNLPEALSVLLEVKQDRIELKASPTEAFISARTSRAEQPEALQGIHSQHVMLIADEASGVPEPVFEAAAGSMSGEHAVTLLLGNPTKGSGFFYQTHHALSGTWKTLRMSCIESPRVSDEFVAEMAARYGEDSNAYRIRVLGEFPLRDDDTVIPLELVDGAMRRDVEANPLARAVWGLDVARFGSDKSALCKRKANIVPEPIRRWKGLDLMQLTGAVKAEWDACDPSDRPEEVLVDSIGMGGGVVDRLRELGLPARGVNVSESPAMGQTYQNLRVELWYKAKAWLEARDSRLPEDEGLRSELVTPRYKFTSNGKIVLEAKEDMKKRGLPSPDAADAFVLTFASDASVALHGGLARSWAQPIRRNLGGIV